MPGEERRLDLDDLAIALLDLVLNADIHRLCFLGSLRSTPSLPSGVFIRQQTDVPEVRTFSYARKSTPGRRR